MHRKKIIIEQKYDKRKVMNYMWRLGWGGGGEVGGWSEGAGQEGEGAWGEGAWGEGAGIQCYGQSFETVQLRRESHLGWLSW